MLSMIGPSPKVTSTDGIAILMVSKFSYVWSQITSQFWFRVSLYALSAVVAVLIAELAAPLIPKAIVESVNKGASRELLKILASSMLVVATFSLGSMVQAYSAAASLATPRATRILINDPKSQRVLSTFLGAFVYAMVGLLFQGFGYYNPAGDTVLLGATALVVIVVIGTLFGWLDHLANLVRLGETIKKVETRAAEVFEMRLEHPNLGGVPLKQGLQETRWPVFTHDTGYVQYINLPKLNAIADRAGEYITVGRIPGALADPHIPLANLSWAASDQDIKEIRDAFTLDHERSFDQDPRFCLVILSEIASRALSPGINDPGTAISIIGTQQRLLTQWFQGIAATPDHPPPCARIQVPSVDPADLFEDAFGPLTRDAAPIVEVGLRLQKALRSLSALGPQDYSEQARICSNRALRLANDALTLSEDRDRLANLAADFGAGPKT